MMNLEIKQYKDTEPVIVRDIDWGDIIEMFGVQAVLEYLLEGKDDDDDAIFECVEYLANDVEEI